MSGSAGDFGDPPAGDGFARFCVLFDFVEAVATGFDNLLIMTEESVVRPNLGAFLRTESNIIDAVLGEQVRRIWSARVDLSDLGLTRAIREAVRPDMTRIAHQ